MNSQADTEGGVFPHNRRSEDQHLTLLNTMFLEISELRKDLVHFSDLKSALEHHIEQEDQFQKQLVAIVQSAFVGGDPVLHRLEHEERLKRAKLCTEFWNSLLAKLGEKTIFGLVAVLGALVIFWVTGHQIVLTAAK